MRNIENGTYNDAKTYCPANAWDCPYYDKDGVCHVDDPLRDCDDWGAFWESWEDWENAENITDDRDSFAEEEIQWAREHLGYNG